MRAHIKPVQLSSLAITAPDNSVLKRGGDAWQGYSPFGGSQHSATSQPRHKGMLQEPHVGLYLCGHGYRAYLPSLTRFIQPDANSPFNRGGLNAYSYCLADPTNRSDENGRWSVRRLLNRILGRSRSATITRRSADHLRQLQRAVDATANNPRIGHRRASLRSLSSDAPLAMDALSASASRRGSFSEKSAAWTTRNQSWNGFDEYAVAAPDGSTLFTQGMGAPAWEAAVGASRLVHGRRGGINPYTPNTRDGGINLSTPTVNNDDFPPSYDSLFPQRPRSQ